VPRCPSRSVRGTPALDGPGSQEKPALGGPCTRRSNERICEIRSTFVLLRDSNAWAIAIINLAGSLALVGGYAYFLPFIDQRVNQFCVTMNGIFVATAASSVLALALQDTPAWSSPGIVWLFLLPLCVHAGWAQMAVRWRSFSNLKRQDLTSPFLAEIRMRYLLAEGVSHNLAASKGKLAGRLGGVASAYVTKAKADNAFVAVGAAKQQPNRPADGGKDTANHAGGDAGDVSLCPVMRPGAGAAGPGVQRNGRNSLASVSGAANHSDAIALAQEKQILGGDLSHLADSESDALSKEALDSVAAIEASLRTAKPCLLPMPVPISSSPKSSVPTATTSTENACTCVLLSLLRTVLPLTGAMSPTREIMKWTSKKRRLPTGR
jgi:hypothetical protein